MPAYDPNPQIIQFSIQELEKIVSWINRKGGDLSSPNVILIGGWAVDAYNPYLGSVDIDLVTNSKTKQSLMYYLRTNEGYVYDRRFPLTKTVVKQTPLQQPIVLDFEKFGAPFRFEGHRDIPFTLDILTNNTVRKTIRGRAEIAVPNRAVLVLLKMKAAWDRSYRIDKGISYDELYEKGKMIKDCSDILALIDPEHGQREIDLEIFGREISRVKFLKDILLRIPDIEAARDRYQMMTQQDIRRVCEDFVSIV